MHAIRLYEYSKEIRDWQVKILKTIFSFLTTIFYLVTNSKENNQLH